jgi:lipopolysaccharide/colanic/teichoic acid biosynthesis glycosyltransferase
MGEGNAKPAADLVAATLNEGIRDTDLCGWYDAPSVVGMIFTHLNHHDRASVQSTLNQKISASLRTVLEAYEVGKVTITFHFFPEDADKPLHTDEALYPDLKNGEKTHLLQRTIKRTIDIAGSLVGLILFSPVFLFAPILIKRSSPGPVFFRQKRLGKFGREFDLLKFRTMHVNNDPTIHQQYVKNLIEGKECGEVKKITNDPRVTSIGRFLRKTSFDEVPQFLNVLMGQMSLVGPRPPIAYEVAEYRCWHRRRILEIKPGITGLWQVNGRSKTSFDDMVRLDLQYVRTQSLWLDLKIILKTPLSLLSGHGAY